MTVGGLMITASYAGATLLAYGLRPERRPLVVAGVSGVLVLAPAFLLARFLIFPAVVWLALIGLVVPVAIVEKLGFRACFRRALRLSRADFVHSIGSLATFALLGLVTTFSLFFLLRGQGDAAKQAAGFLSILVISPVLFLGGALLYEDQAARASARERGLRSSGRGRVSQRQS
jgi:hypothetical protein